MTPDITPMWSLASILSLVGILYLLLCFSMVVVMRFKGWCELWMLLFFGVCWVGLNQVDIYSLESQPTGYQPMAKVHGEWQYIQILLGKDVDPPDETEWVYAMHVPSSEFYRVPPRIWHPACLFYCHFLTLLFSFILWFFIW